VGGSVSWRRSPLSAVINVRPCRLSGPLLSETARYNGHARAGRTAAVAFLPHLPAGRWADSIQPDRRGIPGHGAWARTGHNEYTFTIEKFIPFNPILGQQGVFVFKVKEVISLEGDTYTGRGEGLFCQRGGRTVHLRGPRRVEEVTRGSFNGKAQRRKDVTFVFALKSSTPSTFVPNSRRRRRQRSRP
jgi:hypothetical protein